MIEPAAFSLFYARFFLFFFILTALLFSIVHQIANKYIFRIIQMKTIFSTAIFPCRSFRHLLSPTSQNMIFGSIYDRNWFYYISTKDESMLER